MTFDNLIGNSISRIVHWKLSPVDEKIHLEVKIWKVFFMISKTIKMRRYKKRHETGLQRWTWVNIITYYGN